MMLHRLDRRDGYDAHECGVGAMQFRPKHVERRTLRNRGGCFLKYQKSTVSARQQIQQEGVDMSDEMCRRKRALSR
jgi:hypothetical protein